MKKIIIVIIILFAALAGTALIKMNSNEKISGSAICSVDSICPITGENVKEFTLNATRFKYDPDTIMVNKGDTVIIKINNIDTLHGIRMPALGIRDNNQIEFLANQTGEIEFYCTVFCGKQHKEMKGKIIVK